ncbi:hypothetical protein SAMN05192584_12424 [Streptomyces pini]|uniref:CR-type domain-containing protein n=1 Tax=Streptomyces pini TaxID=1520580 RepID=A0A1I4JMV4_9ACTN|nr:hypothetical protein SAMN05192584_12424 [Streptomyces pini]
MEQRQKHYGHIDLSDRPECDSLARHRIAPPKDLTRAQTVKLVRRDSVTEDFCPCDNGKTACPRCQGRGDLPCEASTACAACRGIDSCLRCDGTGYRKLKVHEDHGVVGERVTCERCGTHNAACRTCDGRGRTTCSTCHGAGVRDCPDCDRAGTVPHQRCKGAGRIVTWIEGIIRREPRTERIRQPETGVPYPAWSAARESGAWHQLHLTGQDPLPADAASRLLHLVQPHLTPHEGEIARQATFRHLRLARTVVPQHPPPGLLRPPHGCLTPRPGPALAAENLADRRSSPGSPPGACPPPAALFIEAASAQAPAEGRNGLLLKREGAPRRSTTGNRRRPPRPRHLPV